MYKLIVYLMIMLTFSVIPALADLDGSYVSIEYFTVSDDGSETVFGTSGWDCGTGVDMYDVYYKSIDNGYGLSGGIYADYDDVCFEMPLYFRLIEHENRIILKGVIKAYTVKDNKILDGERKTVYRDIEYNKPVTFKLFAEDEENTVGIHLTLLDKKPKPIIADGLISLRTNFTNAHDVFGYFTSSKGRIVPETHFRSSTGKKRDDGGVEKAEILTEIKIPGFPENLTKPFKTELLFKRIYKIDTSYVSDKEFTSDITYESNYKKTVELVPGKTLLLVFPPDTPSVRGFDREDTLIIKP